MWLATWAESHRSRHEFFREQDLHPMVRTAVVADKASFGTLDFDVSYFGFFGSESELYVV